MPYLCFKYFIKQQITITNNFSQHKNKQLIILKILNIETMGTVETFGSSGTNGMVGTSGTSGTMQNAKLL